MSKIEHLRQKMMIAQTVLGMLVELRQLAVAITTRVCPASGAVVLSISGYLPGTRDA